MALNPISMRAPCPRCKKRAWRVESLTVQERMQRHLGRYWLATCTSCNLEAVVYTFKQEKQMRLERQAKEKKAREARQQRLEYATDEECLNDPCDCAFCPEHSEIELWLGQEELLGVSPAF